MSGKFIFLSFFVIMACAKPNYRDLEQIAAAPKPTDSKTETPPPESQCDGVCDLTYPQTNVSATLHWNSPPHTGEYGEFVLQFWKNKTRVEPLSGEFTIEVKLWMSSMGHGSRKVTVEKLDLGAYRASKVYFVMPGDWLVRVQIRQDGNLIDEAIQKIHL